MDGPSGFSLCVVAPCYNEVSVIERFLSTLRADLGRIPEVQR